MSAETELSLLEWALGIATTVGAGFATAISVAFSRMREDHSTDMNNLKIDTAKAIDAMWSRINSMSDGEASRRENLAEKYATKQDLKDVVSHVDGRFAEVNQTIRDTMYRNGGK